MILYDLKCEHGHTFEAWFASSEQYEQQNKKKLINCPICNSSKIKKALMAPKLKGTKKTNLSFDQKKEQKERKSFSEKLKKFKKFIENNTEDVGKNFTEEAKKIYYGETKSRPIRGETTNEQAEELIEEGIPIAKLPWFSRNDA
ncbi:DUF1178 family protein [Alphaproteobacteria bacterium]|nr:DUF1178 family protein [Alphaproteobacteria bacterium]